MVIVGKDSHGSPTITNTIHYHYVGFGLCRGAKTIT